MSVTTRNSNVELLRIISIFVIVFSHVVGGGESLSGINEWFVIFSNSFIHAGVGVTCFELITGYFGNNFSLKKLVNTWSLIWLCSIFSFLFPFLFSMFSREYIVSISLPDAIKAFFPVMTRRYWYASCYIITFLLSPWLNKFVDSLEKKDFIKLLILNITVLYLVPTFLYFEIMNDKGKGLVHMINAYLTGRFLYKYVDVRRLRFSLKFLLLILIIIISFVGNMIATLFRGQISWPFSRECTVTTFFMAIVLLLIAIGSRKNYSIVNKTAEYVFPIYLLNSTLIKVLEPQLNFTQYNSWMFIPVMLLITVFIFCCCFVIAIPLKKFSNVISNCVFSIANFMYKKVKDFRAIKIVKTFLGRYFYD